MKLDPELTRITLQYLKGVPMQREEQRQAWIDFAKASLSGRRAAEGGADMACVTSYEVAQKAGEDADSMLAELITREQNRAL